MRPPVLVLLVLLGLMVSPALVRADPPDPNGPRQPPRPTSPSAPPEVEPPRDGQPGPRRPLRPNNAVVVDIDTPAAAGRGAADPASGRAVLAPTALIAPRGAVGLSVRSPLAPSAAVLATYVPVEGLELGGGLFFRAGRGGGGGGSGVARVRLLARPRGAVAGFAEVHATGDGSLWLGGLVASRCVDGVACRTLLSVGAGALYATVGRSHPVVGTAALAHGRRLQVVAEVTGSVADGRPVGLAYLGGRLVWATMSFDAGVALSDGFGLCRFTCDRPELATVGPVIAATVRN